MVNPAEHRGTGGRVRGLSSASLAEQATRPAAASETEENPEAETRWNRYFWRNYRLWSGITVSLLLHSLLLLILAVIIIRLPAMPEIFSLTIETNSRGPELTEALTTIEIPREEDSDPLANTQSLTQLSLQATSNLLAPAMSELVPEPGEINELLTIPQVDLTSHFGGRSAASRERLVAIFGGTPASERAVQKGLKWLADRQQADGSWSFDHRRPRDKHADHQAGSLRNCPIGATSLALLAFLGAGETPKAGRYQQEVGKAVEFLLQSAVKVQGGGADLRGRVNDEVPGGNYPMYAQGLGTIALCECYAMTKDRRVRIVAQAALDFIVDSRNREAGGWRYQPEQTGDLSVTGWMIMALQSGRTAGLRVPEMAFESSTQFLDTTQTQRGSQYAYLAGQGPKLSTTAIGLLCRMYLGWDRELPALRAGILHLSEAGPDLNNIYYNYYATQVLHHAGGSAWPVWNVKMRDWLVETQLQRGPEAGSWNISDPHGHTGGRLYQTCLSIMTLEVYYRHLPLYQVQQVSR